MAEQKIQFNDGAAYERFMGVWSRSVGEKFLDWLKPARGLQWADIGCGNGAFTELVVERCAPAGVQGLDPSEGQLSFARSRPGAKAATFQQGDAQALPYADNSVDIAAMALVIFFVPDPAKGVAEMARVVRPGGTVAAYAWDILGGGFPAEAVQAEMRALGHSPMLPPSVDAANIDTMRALWQGAGLAEVETRIIEVSRTYPSFDEYWATTMLSNGTGPILAKMPPDEVALLNTRVRKKVPVDSAGRVTHSARCHAVKGVKPK